MQKTERPIHVDRMLTLPPLHGDAEASLTATICLLLNLTRAEGRALVRLARYTHVTRGELHAAIAGDDNPTSVTKSIDVIVSRLRKKLGVWIEITTVRNQGYRLAEGSRNILRQLLAEHGADLIAAATPPASPESHRRK